MVRQWQELFHDNRRSQVDCEGPTDFVKLAEAMGAKGFRTSDPRSLPEFLREGLSAPGTVVMDVHVAQVENVYPMVPSGASLKEMVLGPEESHRQSGLRGRQP
jgi:acetolactate synthase-1/2/3 large subunit